MRIYENEALIQPKVNIRARFDFDDDKPVQGIVLDESKEEAKKDFMHRAITNTAALVVALAGFCVVSWWIHGGYWFLWIAFWKWAPGLMQMATTGTI